MDLYAWRQAFIHAYMYIHTYISTYSNFVIRLVVNSLSIPRPSHFSGAALPPLS